MSPIEELLLVLAVVWIWEAALLVPRRAVLFRARWGRRYRARGAGDALGSEQVALLFAPLLPPLGRVHVCRPWPFAHDAQGVVVTDEPLRAAAGARRIMFDGGYAPTAIGGDVVLADDVRVRFDGPEAALAALRALAELAKLPSEARSERRREQMAARLDERAVLAAIEAFERESGALRIACNFGFVIWAVVLPWCALRIGLLETWPWLVAAIVGSGALAIALFVRAHRRLHPEARGERRRHAIAMALAPLEAVRALDPLGRTLLARFEPLAATLALEPREAQRAALATELRAALHPVAASDADEALRATLRDYAAARVDALRAAATRAGFTEAELLTPPRERGAGQRFCPRCHACFEPAIATCADCGGLALRDDRAA